MAPGRASSTAPLADCRPQAATMPTSSTHIAVRTRLPFELSMTSEPLRRGDDFRDPRQPVDEKGQCGNEYRADDQSHRLLQLDTGCDQLAEPAGAGERRQRSGTDYEDECGAHTGDDDGQRQW